VALGLVGTYYVVVKPSRETLSGYPYALAVVLQDSDLEGAPLVVKNFDSEVEPNNFYSQANPLATGVTMYGLINLRFDSVIEGEDGASYGQGEPDWFVYETAGNEIATLSFCDKEVCEQGDWEVRVYDAQGAALADAGADAAPLVAFNTASGLGWPDSVHFGLIDPGSYYILVNHKRKFDAPCRESRLAQECLNPGGLCVESVCSRTCRITASDNAGNLGAACSCPEGSESCNVFVADDVSLSTCSCGAEQCGDVSVPNCGFDDLTLQDVCWERSEECLVYGGVVEVPEDETTSQYNFTLFGTKLDPFTVNTPAYDQFEQRPSWFNSP
jgi:hypothetical protein